LSLEVALRMTGLAYSAWERGRVLCSSWALDRSWLRSFPDCGCSFWFGLLVLTGRWIHKAAAEF